MTSTFAQCAHDSTPRSLWYEQLERWAGTRPLDEWLVEEANVRGYLGASGRELPERPADPRLTDEDLVVALLCPRAVVDGRIFKLVVRVIQSGRLDIERLLFRARSHRANGPLYWLIHSVPETERNASVLAVLEKLARPRGYRPLHYDYDPNRLVRRPATRESLWRVPRS